MSFRDGVRSRRRLLASPEVRELRDPEADVIQIEEYIRGTEYALEGVLEHGVLRTLAIFDKPDPLEGPFFEETIYVTPSRVERRHPAPDHRRRSTAAAQRDRLCTTVRSTRNAASTRSGVFVLEIAARPIGGLVRAVRCDFVHPMAATIGFEEFLLRHARRRSDGRVAARAAAPSAVMMIPIPRSGVYRGVDGVEAARAVPHVDEIQHHGQGRSAVAGAAGRRQLSRIYLCARAARAPGRTRRARSARAAAVHDRSALPIARMTDNARAANASEVMRPYFDLLRARSPGGSAEPSPKKKSSICAADQLLAFLLPRHQPVLVEDHLLALLPELPCLRRHVLVDALADLAGPRRRIEARQFLLELDALHRPAALVRDRFVVGARRPSTHCHKAL